jgi:hypothetical protein
MISNREGNDPAAGYMYWTRCYSTVPLTCSLTNISQWVKFSHDWPIVPKSGIMRTDISYIPSSSQRGWCKPTGCGIKARSPPGGSKYLYACGVTRGRLKAMYYFLGLFIEFFFLLAAFLYFWIFFLLRSKCLWGLVVDECRWWNNRRLNDSWFNGSTLY